MTSPRPKLDIPFQSDDEILDLVARFEDQTWPYDHWTHRAHLAVALVYLQRYPFDGALTRIRQNIQSYTHPHNPGGYHETITILFMTLIAAHLRENGDSDSLATTVDRLFNLYTTNTPLEFYSEARLRSSEAKNRWVEPNLKPLPIRQ